MIRILQKLLQSPGGKKAAANLWKSMQRQQKMAPKALGRGTPRPNKHREAWELMAKNAEKRAALRKGAMGRLHPGTPRGVRERGTNSFPGIKQGSKLNAYQKSELMARNMGRPRANRLTASETPERGMSTRAIAERAAFDKLKTPPAMRGESTNMRKFRDRKRLTGLQKMERTAERSYNFPRKDFKPTSSRQFKRMSKQARAKKIGELREYYNWLSKGGAG